MTDKVRARPRRRNVPAASLPLLDLMERPRWCDAPRVAKWVARRCGIASPSAARTVAQLAGLGRDEC